MLDGSARQAAAMNDRPLDTIDFPRRRSGRRRFGLLLFILLGALLFGGGAALSYYVDALWFASLGYRDVFWKTVNLQGGEIGRASCRERV